MENPELKSIRTMVVDDEPIACEGLRLLLEKDPEIELIDTCTMGIDAIKKIRIHRPDLLFLDIQMPKVTGFDVLEALTPEERPITVFVTAYDQFALKAFEVNAIDYLMKPFDDARFFQTLEKAKRYFRQSKSLEFKEKLQHLLQQVHQPVLPQTSSGQYLHRLAIRQGSEILFVKVEEIDWITADDYYVNVHVKNKQYLLRESLNNLEEQLPPTLFLRIHRCTIINIDRIRSIQPYFNNEYIVLTHSGEKFKVSRSKKEALKNLTGI